MWAVLSDPAKLGGHWDESEFFRTGEHEIDAVMEAVRRIFPQMRRGRALDFGCGLGRLSRALASRFESVTGVDIAPSMIAGARTLNQAIPNCSFVLNERGDLRQFPDNSFDFVYTNIVLQHMNPRFATCYIREFVRSAATGGIIVFRLPDRHPAQFDKWLKSLIVPLVPLVPKPMARLYLRRHYPNAPDATLAEVQRHPMELHGARKHDVIRTLHAAGAAVAHVEEDIGEGWRSFRYFARKT